MISVEPFVGSVRSIMFKLSLSGSVSFARTSIVTGVFSWVVTLSLFAIGGLFSSGSILVPFIFMLNGSIFALPGVAIKPNEKVSPGLTIVFHAGGSIRYLLFPRAILFTFQLDVISYGNSNSMLQFL